MVGGGKGRGGGGRESLFGYVSFVLVSVFLLQTVKVGWSLDMLSEFVGYGCMVEVRV